MNMHMDISYGMQDVYVANPYVLISGLISSSVL